MAIEAMDGIFGGMTSATRPMVGMGFGGVEAGWGVESTQWVDGERHVFGGNRDIARDVCEREWFEGCG